MTDPSQYFKGRTVQEQMNEVIGYVDVRSAEVAVDAIASDVAQVHQDMLDADADASAAAASAAAAAGTLANAVKKTGESSQSIAGDIAVAGDLSAGGDLAVIGDLSVSGTATVPTPVNNTDATNKKYVDDANALKADKTYVDAQDALKINITDINNYAVGLTGNQTKTGQLVVNVPNYAYSLAMKDGTDITNITTQRIHSLPLIDVNSVIIAGLRFVVNTNGEVLLQAELRKTDGTYKYVTLANNE